MTELSKLSKFLIAGALFCVIGFLVAMILSAGWQPCFGFFLVGALFVVLSTLSVENDSDTRYLKINELNGKLSQENMDLRTKLREEQSKRGR